MKGGYSFSYNNMCKSNCKNLYYWPNKDETHPTECTTTECDYYKTTESGYECNKHDSNSIAFIVVLGVVGGVIVILGISFLIINRYKDSKCCRCSKSYKPIDIEHETQYVESDKS